MSGWSTAKKPRCPVDGSCLSRVSRFAAPHQAVFLLPEIIKRSIKNSDIKSNNAEGNYMSYDLMVFEKTASPKTKKEFLKWYDRQVEWDEGHNYNTTSVASPALQNWFMEMIQTFPPINGELAPDHELVDREYDQNQINHLTDYSIGADSIYACFSWPLVEEDYGMTRALAKKHDVGFFEVSAEDGVIVLPDGTELS